MSGRITVAPVLAIVVLSGLQQFRFDSFEPGWSVRQGIVTALSGIAAFAIVTLIGARIVRGRQVSLWALATTWALASLARVAAVTVAASFVGLSPTSSPARALGLFLTSFVFALAVSVITETQVSSRRALAELALRRHELSVLLKEEIEMLAQARRDLVSVLQDRLEPLRDSLRRVQQAPMASRTFDPALAGAVDKVLRPATWELMDSSRQDLVSEFTRVVDRSAVPKEPTLWRSLNTFASTPAAVRPWWPLVVLSAVTPWILANLPAPPPLLAGFGTILVAVAISMFATAWAWRRGFRPRPGWPAPWLGVLLAYSVAGMLASTVILGVQSQLGFSVPISLPMFITVAFGLGGSFYSALRSRQRQAEESVADAVARMGELEARLRREIWFDRHRLANLLHGHVQARLISAQAHFVSDSVETKTASVVNGHLREALAALESLHDSFDGKIDDPMSALQEISDVWAPTMTVDFDVELAVLERSSPATTAAIIEIVTEAVLNARKHGEARHVEVRIHGDGQSVSVEVYDDGQSAHDGPPGFGSTFLDLFATSWNRCATACDGTRLSVVLDEASPEPAHP